METEPYPENWGRRWAGREAAWRDFLTRPVKEWHNPFEPGTEEAAVYEEEMRRMTHTGDREDEAMEEKKHAGGDNPANQGPKPAENLRGMAFYEIKELEVAEYHPLPDGQGDPTQVHLLIRVKEMPYPIVMRFKGPQTLNAIINALRWHGRNVWGEEIDPNFPQS